MCRWAAIPPKTFGPEDGRALYELLVQNHTIDDEGDLSPDRGLGFCTVDGKGEFILDKYVEDDMPFDRTEQTFSKKFMEKHFPNQFWVIMHHRYGNQNYGKYKIHVHPWVHENWCSLGNGAVHNAWEIIGLRHPDLQGKVDTEVMAWMFGRYGPNLACIESPHEYMRITVGLHRDGVLAVEAYGDRGNIYKINGRDLNGQLPLMATSLTEAGGDGVIPKKDKDREIVMIPKGVTYFNAQRRLVQRYNVEHAAYEYEEVE